jgi:hypothetical protein
MNPVFDYLLVALLITISVLIVGYSFTPLNAQRWILSKLSRYVGIRMITWLLPKQCGCEGCPTTDLHSRLKTIAKKKQ